LRTRVGGSGQLVKGGHIEIIQRLPVFARNTVSLGPALRRRGMNLDPLRGEFPAEPGSAVVLNNLLVRPHSEEDTTICASGKHNLSLARTVVHWQLRRMAIGKRIEQARRAKGWSQQRLAEAVGKQQTTVSSWERSRTEPTREDVLRIANALLIEPAALELDDPRPNVTRPKVPLVGYVGAGAAAHFASADDPAEEVDAPEDATVNTVAAEIRGVSLGPAFDRWLVFYDDVRSPVTPDLHGQLCVVGTADQVLVKILRPAGEPNHFHLISNSGEEPLFDRQVDWAAKVKNLKPR